MKILALLFPLTGLCFGQVGLPFIKWFSPQDYGGSQQVWSFQQDDQGMLYAGLSNGLRQYDGTSWRAIATPHNSTVRGLARGPEGRIYVGEVGDFGYLESDKNGEAKFRSLLEFVPEADRAFQDVRKIHPSPEGIYFQSLERLFLLTPDGTGWRTKVWKPSTRFRNSFYVAGSLYVTVTGAGLYRLKGERLEKVTAPGLEQTPETSVAALLAYSAENPAPKQLLVGTGDGQFQLLDERGLRAFALEDGPWRKLGISGAGATRLPDGSIGLATRGGGFLTLTSEGKILAYLDRASGIPSEGVLAVFSDRSGTVWLGLQNGIAKVELSSPFSEFGRQSGMSAAVNAIVRHRGVLYVATFVGLKYFDPKAGEFREIKGIETSGVVGLLAHGDHLLAATGRDGLFEVTGTTAKAIAQSGVFNVVVSSRQDPNRVWLGTRAGLASIHWDGHGHWVDDGMVAETAEVRSIVEPEPGLLWLGTQARGVVRVRMPSDPQGKPDVKSFTKSDGLAADGGVSVHYAAGRVVFASPFGVREFDSGSGKFVASSVFGTIPTGGSAEEFSVATDRQGKIWANFGVRPVVLTPQGTGGYVADENRLRRIGDGRVFAMAADDDGVVWLGGLDRLFRYDPAKAKVGSDVFPSLIRRVTAGDKNKRVIYAGAGKTGQGEQAETVIEYRDNGVRFEYSIASFEDPSRNQFQSRLEGFDADWSAWTLETRRDYTNLPPGNFVFRLKAKNYLSEEGAEATYRLQILPPVYRTWWAYVLYGLALATGVFFVYRIVHGRVLAQERERSILREAQLRAETAAAEAKTLQAENDRNKNVQLLSEIGKEITSSLDLDTIFYKLYERVQELTDATIFGVGIFNEQRQEIEYRLALENGEKCPPCSRDTKNRSQFSVWCIENRKPVFINDLLSEYSKYIEVNEDPRPMLDVGTKLPLPASVMYLPLMMKDHVMGVITVQSFKQNAYSEYHLDLLENLASYTAIALDNADSYLHLKTAQDQLLVQEKLASLGALTAGIAHEIKNPLNFVNNFAELSVELMEELQEEVDKLKAGGEADIGNMEDLLTDLTGNAKKINEHGKRADGIVKSMLLHSRGQAGERQPTDINAMLEENVNLSYHGMRATDTSFNVRIERDFDKEIGKVDAIAQDLSRVFLNILNNACYATHDRMKKGVAGYKPELRVKTANLGDMVEVRIRDNGMGIPPQVLEKIFNPFFTTKPTGQGTGLGLSISHDIVVQAHGGQLEVDTVAGEYTEFIVRVPRHWRKS